MRPVRIIAAFVFATAVAVTGCTAHPAAVHPATVPTPASSASPPPTTAPPHPLRPNPPASGPAAPTTTLPLGRVEGLDAVQAIGGTATAWAVGQGAILATSDGGRTWARVWRGPDELYEVDFVSASTGWALGDGILLGTVDRGQHWHTLGQPRPGPLWRIHFSSRTQGWGVAGDPGQVDERSIMKRDATRLVHTTDGGQTWSALAAPAPPQTVCFTAPHDGWLASQRSVWRSTDGGHSWRPSFTLPMPADGFPFFADLQCAAPGAAWVRFDYDHARGRNPYALYATGDRGAHWHGVLAEPGTQGNLLHLPIGPGTDSGPLSVIDPGRAVLLSPTPPADATGAVLISQGNRLRRLPDIPGTALFRPASVSFASATRGWVVGTDRAGRAVLLATVDGGRTWQSQLRS